jgi:hypothetical protein
MMFLSSSFVGLIPIVTAVERQGGFGAVRKTWSIVRRDFGRNVLTMGVAHALLFTPSLAGYQLLHPGPALALAIDLYQVLVAPLVVLVSLSVYAQGREAAGAEALRADLDAR